MSYKQQARELSVDIIRNILQQHGSVKAVVEYITGGKLNEGVRAIVADRVRREGLTGLRCENVSTRYTPQQLKDAISDAGCWSDIYRALGLSICDHNKASIQRFAKHHNIKLPVFTKEQLTAAYQRGGKQSTEHRDVFCENSKFPRSSLRNRVVKTNVLGYYECVVCGSEPVHMGKELMLELDHINGIHNDNRVENLRWLCPNCHSQTHTFKGKNR